MPTLIPASRDATSRAAKRAWESRRYNEALKTVVEQYTQRIRLCVKEEPEEKE